MKKLIMLFAAIVVISVSAAILGCSNSKGKENGNYHNNSIVYEDKDIKLYSIDLNDGVYKIAYSKKSGDISVCR